MASTTTIDNTASAATITEMKGEFQDTTLEKIKEDLIKMIMAIDDEKIARTIHRQVHFGLKDLKNNAKRDERTTHFNYAKYLRPGQEVLIIKDGRDKSHVILGNTRAINNKLPDIAAFSRSADYGPAWFCPKNQLYTVIYLLKQANVWHYVMDVSKLNE